MANHLDSDKKKSHCFRNCLITTIVLIVVICGAIFGGGYFAYEKFARPIVNISLWEMFDIVGSLGKYDETKIVDKPFTEEDLTGFYSNLEKATYLDLPQDFRISSAVNESLNKPQPEENPQALAEPTNDKFAAVNDFSTNNKYLDSVLKETGFAFNDLKGYEDGGSELVLKDTEFAAVMDEVLSNLSIPNIVAIEEQLGIKFSELLSIKQVKITGVKTLSEAIMAEGDVIDNPATDEPIVIDPLKRDIKISMVLCLNLGENVSKIIKNKAPSVPGFVGDMAAGILPKKIFIGAGVYPYNEDMPPEIFINEIDGKIMDNMLKAISGIMNKMGNETTVDSVFSKISSMIVKTINTMENMVGELRFVDSSMNLDPITAMMSIMKVNVPDPVTGSRDHYLTSHDFLSMLKHIYNSDADIDILNVGNAKDAVDEYIRVNVGEENIVTKKAYTDDINRLAAAYGIKTTPDFNMATWKPSEFATKFKEVPKHMDIMNSTINNGTTDKHIYEYTQAEMKDMVILSDNAMGHMFNDTLRENASKDPNAIPFEMDVKSFEIYELENNPDHLRARFVGSIATTKIIESISKDAVLYKVFKTSMPEHLFLEFDVRFSPDPDHGPGMIVNFVGKDQDGRDKTAAVFDTLYRIMKAINEQMGENVKLENLLNKIQQAADELIAKLEELGEKPGDDIAPITPADPVTELLPGAKSTMVGKHSLTAIELPKPTVHVTKGGLQLPTIYDMIKKASKNKVVVVDPDDITQNVILTPEMIQRSLMHLYTYTPDNTIIYPKKAVNPDDIKPFDIHNLQNGVELTDYYIGYELIENGVVRDKIMSKDADGNPTELIEKEVADVIQMAILTGNGMTTFKNNESAKSYSVYNGLFTGEKGMLMSIKMRDTNDYMGQMPADMPKMIPEQVTVNMVINILDSEVKATPLINDMNDMDMKVMLTILGDNKFIQNIDNLVTNKVLKRKALTKEHIDTLPADPAYDAIKAKLASIELQDVIRTGVYRDKSTAGIDGIMGSVVPMISLI